MPFCYLKFIIVACPIAAVWFLLMNVLDLEICIDLELVAFFLSGFQTQSNLFLTGFIES